MLPPRQKVRPPHRSVTLTFHAHSNKVGLTADPNHMIFERRALGMRRCWWTQLALRPFISDLMQHYVHNAQPGTDEHQVFLQGPMHRPGTKTSFTPWKPIRRPVGPIALALTHASQRGVALTEALDMVVHGKGRFFPNK